MCEEREKDYCVRVPDGVDIDKIEASLNSGVLTVTLPKSAEAQKAERLR